MNRIMKASEFNCKLAQAARVEDGVHIRNAITGQRPLDKEPLADHPNYEHLNNILRGRFVVPGLSRLLKASLKAEAEIELEKYFNLLRQSEMTIVHADLAGQTSEKVIHSLINALPVEHLRNLTLWNLNINDIKSTMYTFANSAMKNMCNLTYLDLCYNMMGDDGVRHLAEGFPFVPRIEILSLSWNNIAYEGTVHLATGIKHLIALTTIYYDGNDFGDRELKCLFESLKHISSLKQLVMSNNKVTKAGILFLLGSVLHHLLGLSLLELSENKIGSDKEKIEVLLANLSVDVYI